MRQIVLLLALLSSSSSTAWAEVANVKDFGAVGNGQTLDQRSYLAARKSGADRIYFPAGHYLVRCLPVDCEVYGDGPATVIDWDAAHVGYDDIPAAAQGLRASVVYNAHASKTGGPFFDSDVYIHDLSINMHASEVNLHNFRAPGETDDTNSHNRVGHGISMQGVDGVRIERVTVRNTFRDGYYLGYNASSYTDNVVMVDCRAIDCGRNGLSHTGGHWCNLTRCTFDGDTMGLKWFSQLSPAPVGITEDDCGFTAGMVDLEPNGGEVAHVVMDNVRCLRAGYKALVVHGSASDIKITNSYFDTPESVDGVHEVGTETVRVQGDDFILTNSTVMPVVRNGGVRGVSLRLREMQNFMISGNTIWDADNAGLNPVSGQRFAVNLRDNQNGYFGGNMLMLGTEDDQTTMLCLDGDTQQTAVFIGPNVWLHRPAESCFRSPGTYVDRRQVYPARQEIAPIIGSSPSVFWGPHFLAAHGDTITQLNDGRDGDVIMIRLASSNDVIANSVDIQLVGGEDIAGPAVVTLRNEGGQRNIPGTWYEVR